MLIAPTLLAAFWITIFGNTAMHIQLFGAGGIVEAVNSDVTMSLFKTIELMNIGHVMTVVMASICTVLLVTYFVTSADSATLVICTLVCMGDENPPSHYRIIWGALVGAVAVYRHKRTRGARRLVGEEDPCGACRMQSQEYRGGC